MCPVNCLCLCLCVCVRASVCVCHWCLPRGAAGAHHTPAGHCSSAASVSTEVPAHVQTAVLLVHINSPIHTGVPEGRRCFADLTCSAPSWTVLCFMRGASSGLWGVGSWSNRNACHLISLVLCQMKGKAEDGLSALSVSHPEFKEVFSPPSRVMDHLPKCKDKKKQASVKKRNASFYLPLSFCAPCSLSSTPFSNISYLSSSQCPILRPENNAFVLLLPRIPPSLHPFVWRSLWHLGHARLRGREGGTDPAIVPPAKPTEYQ